MTAIARILSAAAQRGCAELGSMGAWWLRELRETSIELMDRVVPAHARRFVVELEKDNGIIRQIGRTIEASEQQFSLDDRGVPPPLGEFWPEGAPNKARVIVVLPEASVLIRHLQLPPIQDGAVDSAIDLLLDRELPLPREQLYVDWEIQERRTDRSRIAAIAIARRTDVDRVRDAIQSWGWSILSMGVKGKERSDRPRFNLMPIAPRTLELKLGRRDWHLVFSSAILCLSYGLTTIGGWWFERSRLADALGEAQREVAGIHRRQAELASASEPILALRELIGSKSVVDVLTAMSSAIPPDTWVYQSEIQTPFSARAAVHLEAYTPAATRFVGLLQQTGQFEQVQLIETSSADSGTVGDRVELTARLKEAGPT